MTPEQRAQRAAYMREWRAKGTHAEEDRQRHRAWYARHKDELAAARKVSYAEARAVESQESRKARLDAQRIVYHSDKTGQQRRDRRWRAKDPQHVADLRAAQNLRNQASGKARKWHLRKFGITPEEEVALFDRQGGRCAICQVTLEPPAYGNRRTHLDHDHVTKRVRGFLCLLCNQGLGRFKDDPALLRKAAEYLSA